MSEGSGRVEIVIKGARFTEADAEAHVHGICFKTGPPERLGVELEWLARDRRDPALPVQAEQVTATLAGFGHEARSDEEGYPGQVRPGAYPPGRFAPGYPGAYPGGYPGGYPGAVAPAQPAMAQPGKGGLQTVLKEQLLRITLEVDIVKLLQKS